MLRARIVVPVLTFALSAMAAVAPSITSAAGDSVAVAIHDKGDMSAWGYGPATTTINVGQTVTFTNTGSSPHDATASDNSWGTPLLQPGQSAPITFSTAGTFAYTCVLHPWMKGTIVVTPAAAAPAPAVSSSDAPPADNVTITTPAPAPVVQTDAAPVVQTDVAPAQSTDGTDSGASGE
jgi:plastocyanin